MKEKILKIWEQKEFSEKDIQLFNEFKEGLNKGIYRSAEKINGEWVTNEWVKKGILIGFRIGKNIAMPNIETFDFIDKETYPVRRFTIEDRIRLVPGGSSVRDGAYIAPQVTMMPPMYVNVGAYVDEGSMIDSHALVGTCAQIGKRVHLSAGAMIGGVLEPMNANPVIIEDNCFIGGNTGIYEGVIVKEQAIIAAGVIITGGTPVYDAVNERYLDFSMKKIIPERAVVVAGSRPLKSNPEFSIYCPIIIKYRDSKTESSVVLEELLRK